MKDGLAISDAVEAAAEAYAESDPEQRAARCLRLALALADGPDGAAEAALALGVAWEDLLTREQRLVILNAALRAADVDDALTTAEAAADDLRAMRDAGPDFDPQAPVAAEAAETFRWARQAPRRVRVSTIMACFIASSDFDRRRILERLGGGSA